MLLWSGLGSDTALAGDPYEAIVKNSKLLERRLGYNDCIIKGQIDFDAFIPSLGDVRDAWLNRDYSMDFYRQRRKQVFAFTVIKRYAELVTLGLYQNPKPGYDECRFQIDIIANDKYGKKTAFRAASWRFSLAVASRINWTQFDPRDFQAVAINYELSPAISNWTSDEPKFGP